MTKLIRLKISRIKYTGDSIGDDIRIEITCLDKFVGLNKRLPRGGEAALDTHIGYFFADGVSFTLPLNIKIIERDLVFDDVGSTQEKLKVNLNNSSPQHNTYQVEVQELRRFTSRKRAAFAVTVEALVSDATLYVAYHTSGWIKGKREDTREDIGLVSHLKVHLERYDAQRHYFTITEGILQGVKASVKIEADGTAYLHAENSHAGPVHLTYSLATKTVRLGNREYITRAYPEDPQPWKKGIYDIEIPDAPHRGGTYYLPRAKLAKVWFRVGHSGERYLHVGTYSLGCITLIEVDRWDGLCKMLLPARKGDGRSVGVLEVID